MPFFFKKLHPIIARLNDSANTFVSKRFSRGEPGMVKDGLAYWRERILFSVLASGTGLAFIALAPAFYMGISEGLWALVVFDILAFLGLIGLLVFHRIQYPVRAASVLLITFFVGILIITQAGFLSGGPAWVFCFAVLSGVLLGLRGALAATFLNAISIAILAWLTSLGYLEAPSPSLTIARALTAGANFIFLNAVSAISVAVLVNGLQAMNRKTQAATAALQDERENLIHAKDRLKNEIQVRRQSEKDLQQSERKYRLLAENIQDVIWTMDMQLRFTYLSPAIEAMQGWSPNEYKQLKLEEVMTPESTLRVLTEFAEQYRLGEQSGSFQRSTTLELDLIRKAGGIVKAEVTASFLLDDAGHPVGVLGVTRDITERYKAEREKAELRESLARSKKMEALGTLAGGVAHDLNNVLSGIVSYPDLLLLDIPKDSPMRRPIEVIQESGKKATAIVQDLLTLARRGVLVEDIVNLNDLVSEYLLSPEYNRLKAFHPFINVETRMAPDLLNLKGSPIHLSKTIMNLVSNAAEAMPEGGTINIVTENRYLDASIKKSPEVKEGECVVLQVSDSGVGIPAEDLQRIFEPFFTKKKMGRSGTGLGMAVVWGTVQDHKGHIEIHSVEGRGTEVTAFFPATREAASPISLEPSLDVYKGTGETILVVDDMNEQREIAAKIITQLGYTAKSVESGEKAVEFLEHEKADLLILDMIMDPGIDGLETYYRVKESNPHQKAIITSGYAETDRVRRAQRLGAGGYLKKPYTVHNLAVAIKTELGRG
jgi:two-component system, cell cycle sensor histidine kinase and response regulator CckA